MNERRTINIWPAEQAAPAVAPCYRIDPKTGIKTVIEHTAWRKCARCEQANIPATQGYTMVCNRPNRQQIVRYCMTCSRLVHNEKQAIRKQKKRNTQ